MTSNDPVAPGDVVIDYLANHKQFLSEVVELTYGEWHALLKAAGVSKEQLADLIAQRAVTDQLPITLVAISGGVLVGTGSIKLAEPGTKEGLSPWLAGMYVKPSHRGMGIGASIVRTLEAKAQQLGVGALYLSVGAAEEFYKRLDWTVMERVDSYGVKEVALMTKKLGHGVVNEA